MGYCQHRSPSGFFCVLKQGHRDAHLSIDNTRLWRGTPGRPVIWGQSAAGPVDEPTGEAEILAHLDPTLTVAEVKLPTQVPSGKDLGYTGIFCEMCGSPNTVRIGKCIRCSECNHAGECG